MSIFKGKYTSKPEESFVLFIFGMKINNPFFFWLWLPFNFIFLKMVRRLRKYKDAGMLNAHLFWFWGGVGVIQYWKSFDHLEKFARDKADMHMPNEKRYKKYIGKSGILGVWHETYLVDQDKFETMYFNMPMWGLSKASKHHLEVPSVHDEARNRINMYSNNKEV